MSLAIGQDQGASGSAVRSDGKGKRSWKATGSGSPRALQSDVYLSAGPAVAWAVFARCGDLMNGR